MLKTAGGSLVILVTFARELLLYTSTNHGRRFSPQSGLGAYMLPSLPLDRETRTAH